MFKVLFSIPALEYDICISTVTSSALLREEPRIVVVRVVATLEACSAQRHAYKWIIFVDIRSKKKVSSIETKNNNFIHTHNTVTKNCL